MKGISKRHLKFNLQKITLLFSLLIFLSVGELHAQTKSFSDSLKNAQREQRAVDSLKRAIKKNAEKKYNDSVVNARKQQRIQDSLANVARRKQMKDSLELVKYKNKFGEEKLQEKLDERERIKRMEERYRKQREEDSVIFAAAQQKKRVADSLENEKRMQQRQLYVQDSLKEANLRMTTEKRKSDSLAAALAFQREKDLQQEQLRKQQEASRRDSLQRIEAEQKEFQRIAQLEAKRKLDSLRTIEKQQRELQKQLEREEKRLAKLRKDSIALVKKKEKEVPSNSNTTTYQSVEDSLAQANTPQQKQAVPDSALTAQATPPLVPEKSQKTPLDFQPWDEQPLQSTTPERSVSLNVDSLRKVDSLKYYFSSFRYRLKKSTEISFYLGVSNYLGDLGGNSGLGKKFFYDNNFKKRNNFYGVSLTYSRLEYLAFRLSYMNGKISASDHDIAFTSVKDEAYLRYKRNLDFQTKISEWSLLLEFLPMKLVGTDKRAFKFPVQPYVLAGLGTFRFNPQGSYYDDISEDYVFVDLQPLHTEGQGMKEYPTRKPYALRQWNIPFGVGAKYVFGRRTSLGFEFVGRKLFTDYLDDVSTTYIDPSLFDQYFDEENALVAKQVYNKSDEVDPDNSYSNKDIRGNPKYNDFYYSFNLKFSYRLSKLK